MDATIRIQPSIRSCRSSSHDRLVEGHKESHPCLPCTAARIALARCLRGLKED
jgi:hypothetical protein